MNDIQHVEAAREFASRIIKQGGETAEERIHWGWRVVTSRQPSAEELAVVARALERFLARYAADAQAAAQLIAYGESKANSELAPAELAAYTLVANMLLNLDEAVSRN